MYFTMVLIITGNCRILIISILMIFFCISFLCQNTAMQVSYALYDMEGAEYILKEKTDTCMIPASLMKIIITSISADILGTDFCFNTDVFLSGAVKGNVFYGKINIKGQGDPTLRSTDLMPLAGFFKYHGIDVFKGEIIIDKSIFDDEYFPLSWGKRDGTSIVYSRVSGFNIDHNLYEISIVSENPLVYETKPEPCGNDALYIEKTIKGMYGSYKKGEKIFVRASDMECYPESAVRAFLLSENIEFIKAEVSAVHEEIFRFSAVSKKLGDILSMMNRESDNLIAEALLKYIAYKKTGVKGSYRSAINVLRDHFKPILTDCIEYRDGSGFARGNRISNSFLINLLSGDDISVLLDDSHGKLSEIMGIDIPVGFKIYFKTGSIWGVRSLASYIKHENRLYVFSVIINGTSGHDIDFSEISIYLQKIIDQIIYKNE